MINIFSRADFLCQCLTFQHARAESCYLRSQRYIQVSDDQSKLKDPLERYDKQRLEANSFVLVSWLLGCCRQRWGLGRCVAPGAGEEWPLRAEGVGQRTYAAGKFGARHLLWVRSTRTTEKLGGKACVGLPRNGPILFSWLDRHLPLQTIAEIMWTASNSKADSSATWIE